MEEEWLGNCNFDSNRNDVSETLIIGHCNAESKPKTHLEAIEGLRAAFAAAGFHLSEKETRKVIKTLQAHNLEICKR